MSVTWLAVVAVAVSAVAAELHSHARSRIARTFDAALSCSSSEFACDRHGYPDCIPLAWRCDNVQDCSDLKDEAGCNRTFTCDENKFECSSGGCLDPSLRCNGFDDCGNPADDERDCPSQAGSHSPVSCPPHLFHCRLGPCISADAWCDGFSDCPEGDDERGCQVSSAARVPCAENQFECASDGRCLPLTWACDRMADCDDHSDEDYCHDGELVPAREDYEPAFARCTSEQFECGAGGQPSCVPRSRLCDGADDCSNGADEGGLCSQCGSYGCNQTCVASPLGAACACPTGMQLGMDLRSCDDVDECFESSGVVCDQACENVHGSFLCHCADGYELAPDGHRCLLRDSNVGLLLVSFGHEVRTLPLGRAMRAGMTYGPLLRGSLVNGLIRGLDFNSADQNLYMAVTSLASSQSAVHGFHGQQFCLVDRLVGLSNVAVDWVTGNIYFTLAAPSPRPGIGVCTSEGRFCRMLIYEGDGAVQRLRGLVLHPRRGLLFWTDWSTQPRISTAGMDGADRHVLVDSKINWPNGLSMDYVNEQLYWADATYRWIERIDILTGNRRVVVSKGVHHPYDLAVFDHRVFWTDWNIKAVVSVDLRNSSKRAVLHSLPELPYGLAVNHPVYQNRSLTNPCVNSRCNHLCVLSHRPSDKEVLATCLCAQHHIFDADRRQCVPNHSDERPLDLQVPGMCVDTYLQLCKVGGACLNNGSCVLGRSTSAASFSVREMGCACPAGLGGTFCEIDYRGGETPPVAQDETADSSNLGWLAVCVVAFSFLLLVGVLTAVYIRRTGIHNKSSHGRLLIGAPAVFFRRATGSSSAASDRQGIVTNESKDALLDVDGMESFSNPLYEDPDNCRTALDKIYPKAPYFDNDSGLGASTP